MNWTTSHRAARPRAAALGRATTASRGWTGPWSTPTSRRSSGSSACASPRTCRRRTQLILRGAAALGLEAAQTRRNGVDCGDCGRCGFGCRRGAKQSGLRVHLAEAWRHGARIVPDAPVERVLIEDGRASGVEASVTVDGRPAPPRRSRRVGRRRRGHAAHARRPPPVGRRPPGDGPPPAPPPGVDPRRLPRRGRDDVARHDAGGALDRAPRGRTPTPTAAGSSWSRRPARRG